MDAYESTKAALQKKIQARKAIYKFRTFMYSVNRDVRHDIFDDMREWFINEHSNNSILTITERGRLNDTLNHFQWNTFETAAVNWWTVLSHNHIDCMSLLAAIHLWIDDLDVFDPDATDTQTLGLR